MIYLDNSATTAPAPEALAAVQAAAINHFVNPSAPYGAALRAEKEYQAAQAALGATLCVPASRIVFTSGGTESANMVVQGVGAGGKKMGRLLITAGEHPCVYEAARRMEALGWGLDIAPLTPEGKVEEAALLGLVKPDTLLAAVMHVNNETGAVNDIVSLAQKVKEINPAVLFFSDGVQAHLRVAAAPGLPGVDFYSASAHKIHGPKGVGLLYCRQDGLTPLLFGGGQQNDRRPGTLNLPGAAGYAAAAALWQPEDVRRLHEKKDFLCAALSRLPAAVVLPTEAPHILMVSFPPVRAAVLQAALEEGGALVGKGSACSSRSQKLSRVLEGMKLSRPVAEGAVRISLGLYNTREELEAFAEIAEAAVARLARFKRR